MHIFTCKHSHTWLCILITFSSLLLFHTHFSLSPFVTISPYIPSSPISSLFIFLIFSLKTPHPLWLLFLIVHLLFPPSSFEFLSFSFIYFLLSFFSRILFNFHRCLTLLFQYSYPLIYIFFI